MQSSSSSFRFLLEKNIFWCWWAPLKDCPFNILSLTSKNTKSSKNKVMVRQFFHWLQHWLEHFVILIYSIFSPDFFRGAEVNQLRLQGLEHILQFTAVDGKILLRSYRSDCCLQSIFSGFMQQMHVTHKIWDLFRTSKPKFGKFTNCFFQSSFQKLPYGPTFVTYNFSLFFNRAIVWA